MAKERVERRLAAILVADVVGYSRLMEQDEAGTVAALKDRRKSILQPLMAQHRGRIVKVMGDGVLVEFASAVNAVQCAIDLQKAMANANADRPENRHIVLRIGVNLGDVVVEGSDLYGDGVNMAARLEALAEPGSILVSGTVYDHVKNKIECSFDDLGAQSLKNIAEPVRIYHLAGTPAVAAAALKTLTDRPSIAVLPFADLSGDPDQEYFSDGITEDIITELSRYRELLVIARNSSFQFRDKSVDMRRVGLELGAQYLVEGSVRRAANRVRVTAQLIDAPTGSHLWAERYDRDMQDIFSIQDEVAQTIAATLVGQIERSHAERIRRRPTNSWVAYDYFLQAMGCINRYDLDSAISLLKDAIQRDPQYARAYAALATAHVLIFYADYSDETLNVALSYAEKALSIDNNDFLSQAAMGYVRNHLAHWDLARMHLEKAMSLNPNSVFIARILASWMVRVGRAQDALQTLDAALQRDPLQPLWYWETRGTALLQEKRYEEVIQAVSHKNPLQSWDHATLAMAHAYLGHDSEARKETAIAVHMQPSISIAGWAKTDPHLNPVHLDHIVAGLRKAGLPE